MKRGTWICRRCWFAVPDSEDVDPFCKKCSACSWLYWRPEGLDVWIALRLAQKMPGYLAKHVVEQSLAALQRSIGSRGSVGYLIRNVVS